MKPILIVVTGRAGSGKTTLAERLSREWYLPLVSRDRIKEGYVHTQGMSHDDLPDNANLIATNAFFDTLNFMLDRGISCIAEAAFQHKIWSEYLPALAEKAVIHIIICRIDAELALERFLKRGAEAPLRLHFHGDKGVKMAMSGVTPVPGTYEEPHIALPTCHVDTTNGYTPSISEIARFIFADRANLSQK